VPSVERLEHLKAALKEVPRIRVLRGLQPHVALIDFVVIDSHNVVFSRPDADVAGSDTTLFALVKDATLGRMFSQFFCLAALASNIWQRRTVKASRLRNPASSAARSSSVTWRIHIGGFIG
jgi:hypothetical protein